MYDHLCDYGCGQFANYFFAKAQKFCCSSHYRKCPYQAQTIGAKRIGKKHSDSTKATIGAKTKERLRENGGSYFKGKHHTDEAKDAISKKNTGRPAWSKGLTSASDERVARQTEFKRGHPELYANVGIKNGMFGKTHTNEVKQRLRELNIESQRWAGENNPWYGQSRSGTLSPRYLPEAIRRDWLTYKSQARYWTEREYAMYEHEINPSGLTRGIREYHLDHMVPLWYGFIHGMDPMILSKKENLRMIWFTSNLSRSKERLDVDGSLALQTLTELYAVNSN